MLRPLAIGIAGLTIAGLCHAQSINTLTAQETADGWESLFDGTSLDGWTCGGDLNAWGVREGHITVVNPGHGWWLRTTKMYRDFDLKLEFRIPEGGNSGVGIRGSSNGDPAFTGMEIQILDTHGQEPDVGSCGAVYNAIAPSQDAARPAGEWNSYRIRLIGDTLDVWLNGVHIQDAQRLDDRGYFRRPDQPIPLRDRLTTGYIALQDHGNGLAFQNVKIKDMSPDSDPGGFVSLMPGADMAGWFAKGGGTWAMEDGTLVGRDGPGHLFSVDQFTDFELRAFARVSAGGNSGLYFRTVPRPEDPDTWPLGYEAQVDNDDPRNWTGCIYDRAQAPGGFEKTLQTRDDAWFDYRIRAVGNHIQTWINGVPMVDTTLDNFDRGHFALQTHNPGNVIEYRDIRVLDLREAQSEPPGNVIEAGS